MGVGLPLGAVPDMLCNTCALAYKPLVLPKGIAFSGRPFTIPPGPHRDDSDHGTWDFRRCRGGLGRGPRLADNGAVKILTGEAARIYASADSKLDGMLKHE